MRQPIQTVHRRRFIARLLASTRQTEDRRESNRGLLPRTLIGSADPADKGRVTWLLVIWIALIWLWGTAQRFGMPDGARHIARRLRRGMSGDVARPFDWSDGERTVTALRGDSGGIKNSGRLWT